MKTQSGLIPVERIANAIYFIRGEKVMLFVLTSTEFKNWRSQFVISNDDRKGLRHPPMAFTEHGILMLSSVRNSGRAVQVNIEIMRAFVKLRRILASNVELSRRLDDLEQKYDHHFKIVVDAIRSLMTPRARKKREQIGFRPVSKARKR